MTEIELYKNGGMEHKFISAIIIDDEIEACSNLTYLIEKYVTFPIKILGVANNTKEAELKIKALKPDVIFLDVEMPNENAFQFLARLERLDFHIIFVTAYDEYAIRAFKLNALGYILKPIDVEELLKAVTILQEKIIFNQLLSRYSKTEIIELVQQIDKRDKPFQLILNDTNHWEAVPFSNIIYINASGSYSKIFYTNKTGAASRILSKAISEYESLLPSEIFYRVHKSFLVNCSYIQKILKSENKEIQLTDGCIIPIGRRRYTEFLEFIKTNNFNDGKG